MTKIVYVILAAIALLKFYPLLSSTYIFIERDLASFFIPPRYLWVHLVNWYQVPYWNPYNYSGIPLLALLQPGVLYPPQIIYLIAPFNIAWNWLIVGHFFLAGAGTYRFAGELRISQQARFVAAVTFMLSGYVLSVHNLLTHLFAVAWFPFVLTQFLRFSITGKWKHMVYSACFLSLEFLAGAPEIAMMTGAVLALIAFCGEGLIGSREEGSGGLSTGISRPTRIFGLGLTFVIFLLLVSAQSIPFYELKIHSIRSGGLSYDEATTWSFGARDLLSFFLADPFGYYLNDEKYWSNQAWLKSLYLGIMPFVLSAFYFVRGDRKRLWFLVSVMVLSIMISLGKNNAMYSMLYHMPPFNSIRFPVKFLFVFFFSISITAGLGFETLKRNISQPSTGLKVIILIMFYLGFAFALTWGFLYLFEPAVYSALDRWGFRPEAYNEIEINIHNLRRSLFFSVIFSLLLTAYLRMKGKGLILIAIIGLLSYDLFSATYGSYRSTPWAEYTRMHPFVSYLDHVGGIDRYLVSPRANQELRTYPYSKIVLNEAYAPLFGLYSADGQEVMRIREYDLLLHSLKEKEHIDDVKPFLNMMGVRYVINTDEMKHQEFRLVRKSSVREQIVVSENPNARPLSRYSMLRAKKAEQALMNMTEKNIYLYEYTSFPGRFVLCGKVFCASNLKDTEAKLLTRGIEFPNSLILNDCEGAVERSDVVRGTITVQSYHADMMVLTCTADAEAYLYVSDTYYPGWRAYVDGKETRIYRANLAFRAIQVPKGTHRVEFRYVPCSFYIGLVLSLIGVALSIGLILWDRRKAVKDG